MRGKHYETYLKNIIPLLKIRNTIIETKTK